MDRISGLPDDVIGHILSFLPTLKSLVQTSVLAKDWRFRWAHVTCFAYYRQKTTMDSNIITRQTSVLAKGWRFLWAHVTCMAYYRQKTTMDSNIITRNNNDISSSDLHRGLGTTDYDQFLSWIVDIFARLNVISSTTFHIGTTDAEFESWILALRNVRILVIHLDHHIKLPRSLFASETLVHLCLINCGCISMTVAVDLPALRKLQLSNVVCESLAHLLSKCPVLEELIVERMIFSVTAPEVFNLAYCNVSSPTLTRLVLDLDMVCLNLDTPALRYLRLRLRQSIVSSSWGRLDSLTEANIDLNEEKFEGIFSDRNIYKCIVRRVVPRLCNVKCLTLSTRRIDCPNSEFSNVKFDNLTDLKLSADWEIVTSFLVKAKHLHVLTICRMIDQEAQLWVEPKPLPNCSRSQIDKTTCLKSTLERVNVVNFGWSTSQELKLEFDMISYILRYAKVLKTMEILYTQHFELDSNKKLEAHNKLALSERGSKKCELVFH